MRRVEDAVVPMKLYPLLLSLLTLVPCLAFASDQTRDVQTELKSQGFYYGEITGDVNAETTAALKRYQIRNGLEVTGTATKDTLNWLLGAEAADAPLIPKSSSKAPPPVKVTPVAPKGPVHLRRNDPDQESDRDFLKRSTAPRDREPDEEESESDIEEYTDPSVVRRPAPMPPASRSAIDEFADLYSGTPYASAPPEVQISTLRRAQTLLSREGHYNDPIDGVGGAATEDAILAYQRRARLALTGRLDLATLAEMRLLPGRGGAPMQPFRDPNRRRAQRGSVRGIWIQ